MSSRCIKLVCAKADIATTTASILVLAGIILLLLIVHHKMVSFLGECTAIAGLQYLFGHPHGLLCVLD
jgi:hypothetical protein